MSVSLHEKQCTRISQAQNIPGDGSHCLLQLCEFIPQKTNHEIRGEPVLLGLDLQRFSRFFFEGCTMYVGYQCISKKLLLSIGQVEPLLESVKAHTPPQVVPFVQC